MGGGTPESSSLLIRKLLEDYDPSRSPVSYDVMYLPFLYIWCDVWLGCPLRVDPLPSRHVSLLTQTAPCMGGMI